MKRWEILQRLIDSRNYKSYLEIGVRSGETFNRVKCDQKLGVDPLFRKPDDFYQGSIFKGTSDKFFKTNEQKFDIIFIDGDHRFFQVSKDFLNALKILNPYGVIMFHDMLPQKWEHCQEEQIESAWNGTVYKMCFLFKWLKIDYTILDTDWGCCLVEFTPMGNLPERVCALFPQVRMMDFELFQMWKSQFNIQPFTVLEKICPG